MLQNRDNLTTQDQIINLGHQKIRKDTLREMHADKTLTGDYFYNGEWRIYMCYTKADGTIEGTNDLGSANTGRWQVNDDDSFSVSWEDGWEAWTGFAYAVDGNIKFYDVKTGAWRTTYTKVEDGKQPFTL